MKKFSKFISLLMVLCVGATATFAAACTPGSTSTSSSDTGTTSSSDTGTSSGTDDSTTKTVSKIAVNTEPTVTAYEIGDTFSLEGGTVLVTYTDGTTEILDMTDEALEVSTPGMSASGTKTVTIKYGSKSCRFTITVVNKSYTVTFVPGYAGAETVEQKVVKGESASDPEVTRDGYTLYGWYTDEDYTQKYDLSSGVSSDLTLYALWTEDGAAYVSVTFDYNYYGVKLSQYSYPVKSGTVVSAPANTPERTGYAFAGWTDANGNAYDFTQTLTENTTVYATWTKTTTGRNSYYFEAEDTDFTGKIGPALSGTVQEKGMIITVAEDKNCSGNRCVSYLYQNGLSLEFYIASDEAVDDVTLEISLSAEMVDYTYTPDNWAVLLNGTALDYDAIEFTNVPSPNLAAGTADCLEFQYYTIGVNLSLQKGSNVIRLVTMNNDAITGTTLQSTAPLVDCIRITTTAVVTWDGNYDLPYEGNY